MADYRDKLLKELELIFEASKDCDMPIVSEKIIKVLSNYEVSDRCTDLIPVDSENERLVKKYAACLNIDGKSRNTIYQYVRACRKLDEMLQKPFTEMNTFDIRYFLACEKERGISNISLENARSYISTFFAWLTDEEIIIKNPVAKINSIKFKEEVQRVFSDVEVDRLRSACVTVKERAIMEVLLATGVRVSELCAMKIWDIDFQNLTVCVKEGKGNKERITYITPIALNHLEKYLENRSKKHDCEYLFCNIRRGKLDTGGVRYILKTLGKRAGVENVSPHAFRRYFATNLARRGMDIQDIQHLLGHKKIQTTLTYVRLDEQKIQSAYRKYCD